MKKIPFWLVSMLFFGACLQQSTTVPVVHDKKNVLVQVVGLEDFSMLYVEGGTFYMGSDTSSALRTRPRHQVQVNGFWMMDAELTQAVWKEVMGYNPSMFNDCPSCPVELVSMAEVDSFIVKLNKMTRGNYRLPTEAEWEFAARGGRKSKGYRFAGSNSCGEVAWFGENSGNKTHPVKQKLPNELGLYDLSGNVLEMCSDWYQEDYYRFSPKENPKGPAEGKQRINRGGAYITYEWHCLPEYRNWSGPEQKGPNLGFRLVCDPY